MGHEIPRRAVAGLIAMSRQTVGLADLKEIGIPFAPHVIKAMMNAAHGFPLPINGAPVVGSKIWTCDPLTTACEKSPRRSAAVGTVRFWV